jgi:hypothetical protein
VYTISEAENFLAMLNSMSSFERDQFFSTRPEALCLLIEGRAIIQRTEYAHSMEIKQREAQVAALSTYYRSTMDKNELLEKKLKEKELVYSVEYQMEKREHEREEHQNQLHHLYQQIGNLKRSLQKLRDSIGDSKASEYAAQAAQLKGRLLETQELLSVTQEELRVERELKVQVEKDNREREPHHLATIQALQTTNSKYVALIHGYKDTIQSYQTEDHVVARKKAELRATCAEAKADLFRDELYSKVPGVFVEALGDGETPVWIKTLTSFLQLFASSIRSAASSVGSGLLAICICVVLFLLLIFQQAGAISKVAETR